MADQQFDVSEKLKELFLKKREQRNEMKAYYKRLISNPHTSEVLYDPLIQRYHAMSQYSVEFHRATPKNVAKYIGMLFLPIGALSGYIWFRCTKREEVYRSGQIAYKDRMFKLML